MKKATQNLGCLFICAVFYKLNGDSFNNACFLFVI